MKARMNSLFFTGLALLHFCSSTFATWTEPVPIVEINTDYHDKAPFLSYDGLTLYFSRQDGPGWHYTRIYEATRPEPVGPFTSVEEISTLNYPGVHVNYPWVSPDNLRMYYYITGAIRRLKITERVSIYEPWQPGMDINELNALGGVANPSLTPDELRIFFTGTSVPGGKGGYDIWMATRPDKNSPFANFTNLIEINSSALDAHPSISSDGLTLYFASDRNGNLQLFKTTRKSLDTPFGAPEHLSFFDSPGSSLADPFMSSDGTTLLFAKYTNAGKFDIYVSHISDISEAKIHYVDAVNGDDSNDGLTSETAFATIQKGIDSAGDDSTVLVYPGIHTEEVNFNGKAITVQGIAGAAGVPILESLDNFAVSFYDGEGLDSILKNFIIRNSLMAIFIVGSSPTISNVTVVENRFGIHAYAASEPDISNNIFYNNVGGDLFGCQADYSWVQEEIGPEPLEGLISHWSFDEGSGITAYDLVSDNHGTVHGAQWTAGQVEGALTFDGVDDYVDCGNSSAFRILSDMSVSLWFKRALSSAFKPTLIAVEGGGTVETEVQNAVFYLSVLFAATSQADARYIHEYGPGINEYYDFDTNIAPDAWTHVVVVRDTVAKTVKLYENASLVGGFNYSVDPTSTNEQPKVTIGSRHGGTHNFEGSIDEVAIHDRALSAEEIQQLYGNGLTGNGLVNNPLFVDPANDDYHLLSERGRYWPQHDVWVLDKVTSPCIDGGDPDADYSNEPTPNGGRINMGAYGGTPYASMSEVRRLDPDVNGDGAVDISDIAELIEQWLEAADWIE